MIGEIYNNRRFYYEIIKEFLEGRKTALKLQTEYWEQRDKDLDIDSKNGYYEYEANYEGNEKQFEKENKEKLYFSAWSKEWKEVLAEYEEAANRLEIKGELFFDGIHSFIDEYVR